MLIVDAGGPECRYGLLETLRQFATERLDATGEGEVFRRRHAAAYRDLAVDLAKRASSPGEPVVWPLIEAEWDNRRAAQSHAVATGDFQTAAETVAAVTDFVLWGQHSEGFAWAEALLPIADPK